MGSLFGLLLPVLRWVGTSGSPPLRCIFETVIVSHRCALWWGPPLLPEPRFAHTKPLNRVETEQQVAGCDDRNMRGKQRLTTAFMCLAVGILVGACSIEPEPITRDDPPGRIVDPPPHESYRSEKPERPPMPMPMPMPDVMKCGSFASIDKLVNYEHSSGDPKQLAPSARPSMDLIGAADALNNTEVKGISPVLEAAINAYVYAVTNLGAQINYKEPPDRIAETRDLVGRTANTVATICSQYQN